MIGLTLSVLTRDLNVCGIHTMPMDLKQATVMTQSRLKVEAPSRQKTR
jgi:hypothetical protein